MPPLERFNVVEYTSLKTGDILLFATNTLGNNALRFYGASQFEHAGMVYIDEHNVPWLYDILNTSQGRRGIERTKLHTMMHHYHASPQKYIALKRLNKPISSYTFMATLKNIQHMKTDTLFITILSRLYTGHTFMINQNYMACCELIVYILKQTNVDQFDVLLLYGNIEQLWHMTYLNHLYKYDQGTYVSRFI